MDDDSVDDPMLRGFDDPMLREFDDPMLRELDAFPSVQMQRRNFGLSYASRLRRRMRLNGRLQPA